MKVIIKQQPFRKRRVLLCKLKEGYGYDGYTKLNLMYIDSLGWVIKFGLFGILTSAELKSIAEKIDKYNEEATK